MMKTNLLLCLILIGRADADRWFRGHRAGDDDSSVRSLTGSSPTASSKPSDEPSQEVLYFPSSTKGVQSDQTSPADDTPSLPEGHSLLYEQNFESPNPRLAEFEMTDPSVWRISLQKNLKNKALELFGASNYKPRVRSPLNIAMLKSMSFSDFAMEVDLAQTGREYKHRDLCLFFGMRDASNFYYVHLSSSADAYAHNIFLVNDEDRVSIALNISSNGLDWGPAYSGYWNRIRLERSIHDGRIQVYVNQTKVMEASDKHFPSGYVGFGSFDDVGLIDNIKIWGPSNIAEKYGFFS